MDYETIIKEWLRGHNKEWLINEEYKILRNKYSGIKKKATEVKYEAKANIEKALLRWWKQDVR